MNIPEYTAEGKFATEEEAKAELDTCGYSGKWRAAKAGVTREKPEMAGPAYWDAVRLYFLELGGCWLAQITVPSPTPPADEWQPSMTIAAIAQMGPRMAGPFTKVRQG